MLKASAAQQSIDIYFIRLGNQNRHTSYLIFLHFVFYARA